ncbi:hypothetical protein ACEQ8H_007674 [Pleosporales sp. CAS-2024a]
MATVTIDKSYFEALLRRAEFHTSLQEAADLGPNLSRHVTISKVEHDYLIQSKREYDLLKTALFRNGLTTEALESLLEADTAIGTTEYPFQYTQPSSPGPSSFDEAGLSTDHHHHVRYPGSDTDSAADERHNGDSNHPLTAIDQRTVLISNLSERTTHKDLAAIIRGGRLLDIFLRSDRTATISFVEGAAAFLAYAKRTDVYLHSKRLEFRWADRQFYVPSHVAKRIANGATRNLVVRGGASKLTEMQIRDHLDHIHNLVLVNITFHNGDVYIVTNSIHNALFARTCMMSRTAYKSLRIEHVPDECAAPIPCIKASISTPPANLKTKPITNTYAVLSTGSDCDPDSEDDTHISQGIRLHAQWRDATLV